MLPREAEMIFDWTGLPGAGSKVIRFEKSWGLDSVLYKNLPFLTFTLSMLYFAETWRYKGCEDWWVDCSVRGRRGGLAECHCPQWRGSISRYTSVTTCSQWRRHCVTTYDTGPDSRLRKVCHVCHLLCLQALTLAANVGYR